MKPYTTLLLDFDRTLFDSDSSEASAFEAALERCGISNPAAFYDAYQEINRSLWWAVEQGHLASGTVHTTRFERLAATMELDADPAAMAGHFATAMGAYGDLYPGARKILDELSARASLALVTNGLSEIQRARIDRLGIGEYFEAIIISTEVGSSKPGPAIFDRTFELLGGPNKKSAVMIGDSLSSDIQGGANYGIATCWYNPQGKIADPEHEITHEIADLDQLLSLTISHVR